MIRSALFASTAFTDARSFADPAPSMVTTPSAVQAAKRFHDANRGDSDPMTKRAPDMVAMVDYWDKTDAIVDGIDGMRNAAETYLPKFTDEEASVYALRLKLTKMTNVYTDIVENLASKPFEKEVTLLSEDGNNVPTELEAFIEDVDGTGNNLTAFAGMTFFNGINSAIDWIFIDYAKSNPNVRNRQDQIDAGLRPWWSHVLGRNVLEARVDVVNGREVLTYIRIFEPGAPDKVRVFERQPTSGAITWELFYRSDTANTVAGETRFIREDGGTLTIDVIPLVPFWTGRRDGRKFKIYPAMKDAADLQIDLYQSESGLKYAKTLTGYPMLAANGIMPPTNADGTIKGVAVGPSRILYSKADSAGNVGSWGYVEPSASSLTFLAADIKDTILNLREIGRQPLTAQTTSLSSITAGMAASKARSAVAKWAMNLKNALENAFVITCKWMNIKPETYDPVVDVFTDFDEFTEGKDLEDLNSMRSTGDLSQATFWVEKKRRGVLSSEFDADAERALLLAETPGDGEDTREDDEPPDA